MYETIIELSRANGERLECVYRPALSRKVKKALQRDCKRLGPEAAVRAFVKQWKPTWVRVAAGRAVGSPLRKAA